MRRWSTAAVTTLVVLVAACAAGNGGDDDAGDDDDDDDDDIASVSPTPTASAQGGITAHVTCDGSACLHGKLRTIVFDCMTAETVVVASSGTVTLAEGTFVTVAVAGLPAPALDCLHAVVDSASGLTAVSGTDPQVAVASGTTASTMIVIDTLAL